MDHTDVHSSKFSVQSACIKVVGQLGTCHGDTGLPHTLLFASGVETAGLFVCVYPVGSSHPSE